MKSIRTWLPIKGCNSSIECVNGVLTKIYDKITVCDTKADDDVYVKLNIPDDLNYIVVSERSSCNDRSEIVAKDDCIIFYCDKYHLPIKVSNKEFFDKIYKEYIGENISVSFNCYKK